MAKCETSKWSLAPRASGTHPAAMRMWVRTLILLLLLGGAAPASAAEPSLVRVNAAAVKKLLEQSKGSVVWLNVWATWCQPCVEEFPVLLKLRRQHQAKGLRMVFVSSDFPDNTEAVQTFLKKQGVSFPTYLKDEKDMPFIEGLETSWTGALPLNILYDRTGARRAMWEGEVKPEVMQAELNKLLPKDGAPQGDTP